uniref:HECT-type E3 ubiquitin transferase n=2 Tax=Alexandrium catenella TaxID=2925 RepID=A0A7S1L9Q7_ALECA|mmetsp:Transcript_10790/g.29320  ORF Transcript_10790/g.29320 Transcript_10790/m.29320 type:complete len:814 (+) Transcript_10790:51-2492(+)
MPLTVEKLEACAADAVAADCAAGALSRLEPVVSMLSSREEMGMSFLHGSAGEAVHDYLGAFVAFDRILKRGTNQWSREASRALRGAVLGVVPEPPRRAMSPRVEFEQAVENAEMEACGMEDNEEPARLEVAVTAPAQAPAVALTCVPMDTDSPAPLAEDVPCIWVAVLLAALLPHLSDALPRDHSGVCIIPHPHQMDKQEAREHNVYLSGGGRPVFRTNKICDNCGARITDRYYYHCSDDCDIDFCQDCHRRSQELLSAFLERAGDEDRESMNERLFWVISITERIGGYVLHLSVADRTRLAHELAFEWPTSMFEQLIQATIDMVNAKVVHVQDVKDIQSDQPFWYAMGWLQFLYSANSLPCNTKRLDEQGSRGPKVEYERFILEGINKCEPLSEFQRWRKHPAAKVPDVLTVESFELSADFCSFLTHSNLVPVSFRRVCLLCDVWEQIQALQTGRIQALQLEVPREPGPLLDVVLQRFHGLGDGDLRRPLRVTFSGEEAVGPGVTKEFFQVALRSFLDGSGDEQAIRLFRCNGQQRTYWFEEQADSKDSYRACGILLGQAVLNNVLVPNIFPRVLYERLLHDLESPCARHLGLEDLATVSEDLAHGLRSVLDYESEDISTVFGDLGWARTGRLAADCQLTQENKWQFVQAYVDWFFHERIQSQFGPLSAGFRAILGDSSLLRSMVDAVQLEKIVCGGNIPVDVAAIHRGATHEGWTLEEEADYLPIFWEVLESFTATEKLQFVVFVTASDRVPLRGWQDLGLIVQKNGVGDERLPAAYTCFCQLLLPKYTSRERLSAGLLSAVANSEGFGLR